MELFILIIKIFFGILFCFSGIMHIVKPKFFKYFIPEFLPKLVVNYVVGFLEISLGLLLFNASTIKNAALGILILLIFFLPIHIWDATKIRPAIGSKKVAVFRIFLQFLLIYLAYLIYFNS